MIGYLPVGRIAPDGEALAALFWSLKPQEHGGWRDGFEAWRGQVAALWPALEPALAAVSGPDAFTLAKTPTRRPGGLARAGGAYGDAARFDVAAARAGCEPRPIDAVGARRRDRGGAGLAAALAAARRKRHVRFYQLASQAP